MTKELGLLLSAQLTDQRSVGDNLLTGSAFDTNQVGLMTDLSYGGCILTLSYTRNSRKTDLLSPWGSYPGYTCVQVTNYNLAGERAFMAKASYDFSRLGLPGVAAYGLFVHGWGRVNPSTRESIPDENEVDGDVQWPPEWGFLKGVWFRTRYAVVHQYEGPKNYLHDFRVIVNYDVPLI